MSKSTVHQYCSSNGSPGSSSSDIPDCSNAVALGNRSSDGVTSQVQRPPLLNIKVPRLGDIKPQYKKLESIERPIDIVLLTVEDVEFLNCYAVLTNVCCSYFESLGMVYFGEIICEDGNKVKVALLRCNESAAAVGGSLTVVTNAVASLAPKAVICTGCCGRLDPSRAELGDVVISRTLSTYAHKVINQGQEENRGVRVDVTRHMGKLILSAADGWNPPVKDPAEADKINVHKNGDILSGPELVNNDERRKQLLEKHPTAVGIEMEGEGIISIYSSIQYFICLIAILVYQRVGL